MIAIIDFIKHKLRSKPMEGGLILATKKTIKNASNISQSGFEKIFYNQI